MRQRARGLLTAESGRTSFDPSRRLSLTAETLQIFLDVGRIRLRSSLIPGAPGIDVGFSTVNWQDGDATIGN